MARRVDRAVPRSRAVLSGRLERVECRQRHGRSVEAVLEDRTGSISLRWLGRHAVPGVVPGALVTVEGTVVDEHGRRVLLNPIYQFDRPSDLGRSGSSSSSW